MKTVAVLYCDPRGPYPDLYFPGVLLECWGLPYRNAKRYDGPHPVVAHPPCGPWGRLRHLSKYQDKSCALRAVDQVRSCSGVLEHPAHSKLWDALAMPRPGQPADQFGGQTVEVNQCDWGHVARKTTWLYCVNVGPGEFERPPPREPTHWVAGGRNREHNTYQHHRGYAPEGIKFCSAELRRRTPPDFARYLVKLAASVSQ